MRARRAATALVATVVVASLAACGDSGSSGAADGPTGTASPSESSPPTSAAPSPSDDEACPYLTLEQVETVVGGSMVQTAGSVHACFFDPPEGSGASVMLSRVNLQIHPADYAAQTKALCLGEVTEVEAGDEAFACVMGLGPQGQVYVGKVLVTVNVAGADDDASGIAVAADLLADVSVPPDS